MRFKNYINNFDKEFIQRKLDEGLTIQMLVPIVNIPHKRLGEMIKYFDLNVKSKGVSYLVNHNYFDEIDSEAKAYFLGFIVADGSLEVATRKSGNLSKRLVFSNSIDDCDVIQKLAEKLSPQYIVKWEQVDSPGVKRKKRSIFKITSENIIDVLINRYNILPRKTYHKDFEIRNVPDDYFRHFIRGFMDGDGSINKNDIGFISTSKPFLKQIESEFTKLGFTSRIKEEKGKTINYFRLHININKSNKDIMFSYLYDDATVYLQIKFKNFLK